LSNSDELVATLRDLVDRIDVTPAAGARPGRAERDLEWATTFVGTVLDLATPQAKAGIGILAKMLAEIRQEERDRCGMICREINAANIF
jgi:hypothetical protein